MRIRWSDPDQADLSASASERSMVQEAILRVARGAGPTAISAATDGTPSPYSEFLAGLRIVCSGDGVILRRAEDGYLEVLGSAAGLEAMSGYFDVDEEPGAHSHVEWHPEHQWLAGHTVSLVVSGADE